MTTTKEILNKHLLSVLSAIVIEMAGKCEISGCTNPSQLGHSTCEEHTCRVNGCSNLSQLGHSTCEEHTCSANGCLNPSQLIEYTVRGQVRSLIFRNTCEEHTCFCSDPLMGNCSSTNTTMGSEGVRACTQHKWW